MARSYRLFLSKVKAAQEQAPNARRVIRRVTAQGLAQTYLTASGFSKLAERDTWPGVRELLDKAYGEEETRQLLDSQGRAVRKREFMVVAYRPDLSLPAGTETSSGS